MSAKESSSSSRWRPLISRTHWTCRDYVSCMYTCRHTSCCYVSCGYESGLSAPFLLPLLQAGSPDGCRLMLNIVYLGIPKVSLKKDRSDTYLRISILLSCERVLCFQRQWYLCKSINLTIFSSFSTAFDTCKIALIYSNVQAVGTWAPLLLGWQSN